MSFVGFVPRHHILSNLKFSLAITIKTPCFLLVVFPPPLLCLPASPPSPPHASTHRFYHHHHPRSSPSCKCLTKPPTHAPSPQTLPGTPPSTQMAPLPLLQPLPLPTPSPTRVPPSLPPPRKLRASHLSLSSSFWRLTIPSAGCLSRLTWTPPWVVIRCSSALSSMRRSRGQLTALTLLVRISKCDAHTQRFEGSIIC